MSGGGVSGRSNFEIAIQERIDVAASRKNNSPNNKTGARQSGQALVEFALVGSIMIILALGVIDLGRAIYDKEVITNLTREGSNLASRGTNLSDSATAVVNGSSPLNLSSNGLVIITSVQNIGGVNQVIGQASQGGISCTSKIGQVGKTGVIPLTNPVIPQPNQTIYVTEVCYSFQPITPIGKFMTIVLPSTLYDVAYF
jgi:hypothetical protein